MLKRDNLFPYLIVSIFLHVTIYFLFHGKENPVFLSLPIEVSFYSLSSQRAEQSPAAVSSKKTGATAASAWEQIESNDTKEDIVVKKKKSPEKKVDRLKPEEKPKVQIETDATKSDKQSAKSIGEKKTETTEFSGDNSNVETFQSLNSDKLPAGADSQYEGLSFDAKSFKYPYYSGQIIRKIGRQWMWCENYGKLRALVYFKICRDGTVYDVSIRESSGSGEYDKYALDTIRRATPFPDLPDGYEDDSLGVFFEFKY
ncbi:MAG: TonB family protein [Endomicrobium sp.]|jgi:protein TonB|nr:TonB family protein [Endomicrobium sp.]